MPLIERLQEYLLNNNISAYSFGHACGLSNGYLGNQLKGKGAVGSDMLERIKENYTDLSLVWLVTRKDTMLLSPPATRNKKRISELNEEQPIFFTSKDDVIGLLNKQIAKFEKTIADKDKIIALLGDQVRQVVQLSYKGIR